MTENQAALRRVIRETRNEIAMLEKKRESGDIEPWDISHLEKRKRDLKMYEDVYTEFFGPLE